MRNLLRFILNNHAVFLFLTLEILSFVLIFNFNNYQKVRFLNSSSRISGEVYAGFSKIEDFFRLPSVNRELAEENARLRGLLGISAALKELPDSLFNRLADQEQTYSFIAARVINNTVSRQHNFITLDKGSDDGITSEMGIISGGGVTGIITHVSPSFSTGLSLLNTRWNVSAKLARNNYFGSLTWDGKDYQRALLNEIPFHVDVAAGDTVITSGYSTFFPEGILIGTVETCEKGGGDNFYYIRVKLSVDFKALSYVEVIENNKKSKIEDILEMNPDNE